MFFTISNPYNINPSLLKYRVVKAAQFKILAYSEKFYDYELNNYLYKIYRLSLKELCLILLNNIQMLTNDKNELIIKFSSWKFNNLARLITYGNGRIKGSQILKIAFSS